jgi:hypothetical protein
LLMGGKMDLEKSIGHITVAKCGVAIQIATNGIATSVVVEVD